MRALLSITVFAVFICGYAPAQDLSAPGKLPVKRVVLFKNGVGYFEHIGSVHGSEPVAIAFTSGQLNDVLKSLTVLDLNGGRITGIAYGTAEPVNRRMGDACGSLGGKSTQADLLNAIRGSRIELRNGSATFSGRLLGVEQQTRSLSTNTTQTINYASILSESGELRSIDLSPSTTVRLLEPGLAGRLDRCLTLAATETNADVRNMVISTDGAGNRNLSVSYISEVPVWKSTYRLVLGPEKPLLQGWAIVDNVVGEDWNNVELSLVAGAPQSFIQNLSQPYYAQRPTVTLPDTASLVPQTYEATMLDNSAQLLGRVTDASGAGVNGAQVTVQNEDGLQVAAAITDSSGNYRLSGLPAGDLQLQVTAPGFQTAEIGDVEAAAGRAARQDVTLQVRSMSQSVQIASGAPAPERNGRFAPSAGTHLGTGDGVIGGVSAGAGSGGGVYRPSAGNELLNVARAQALGDLFEYKVKDPITILKNRSALAPIVQAAIDAEKVSVWRDANSTQKPERAVWITNTSGLTLDGGALSVLEDDTFAGEGIFDPIRPGERRLISYATDLAVNVTAKEDSERGRVTRVIVGKGILTQQSQVRETKIYTFRNEDTKPRTLVVEHPVRSEYKLIGETKPIETTSNWMRFKLKVEPKQTQTLVVAEARPSTYQVSLSTVTDSELTFFLSQNSINPPIEVAIRDILGRKDKIADLQSKESDLDRERQGIFDDQQRLRENIKALKGTPEEKPLLERYTRQLDDQETRLETLQKQRSDLQTKVEAANGELSATIETLAFDVKL